MQTYHLSLHDRGVEVQLPQKWDVHYAPLNEAPTLGEGDLRKAFANPIGTPTIADIAAGKKSAIIIVEDVTRPTPAYVLMPLIIEELRKAGIPDSGIKIIAALGCHRPMSSRDFRDKVGDWVVDHFECINPNVYDGVTFVGTTARGTRVEIATPVAQAEVKIGVGSLIPHPSAGFGGGGKIILPGVCSAETIAYHHTQYYRGAPGQVEGNEFRDEVEQIARVAGLDCIVNAVVNVDRQIAGVYVGDVVQAHRAGLKQARQVMMVDAPRDVDVAIVSGFPQEYEYSQSQKALAPGRGSDTLKPDGSLLFVSDGIYGVGYHTLAAHIAKDTTGKFKPVESREPARTFERMYVYAQMVGPREVLSSKRGKDVRFFRSLPEAVAEIERIHPSATVNVFPQGAATLVKGIAAEA